MLAVQALVARGQNLPDVLLVPFGEGGDGKSFFFDRLSSAIWGSGHSNLSSRNLQVDREWQQQGEKHIEKRWLNFDECNRDKGCDEEVVKNLAAGGEQPLRKNHAGDTLSARWQKAALSWCMNTGDIPEIPTAGEDSWGRRLRAVPINNNFVCSHSDVGTNEKGQHWFLADESLRTWLASSRAGITYWYCYLFPFIEKYSTKQCYAIIKTCLLQLRPQPSFCESEWLGQQLLRISASILAMMR